METQDRIIITVIGKDSVGIIGKVCTALADCHINILDISQTIVHGFFNMMMVADMEGATVPFSDLSDNLDKLGESIGVQITCQREEIFDMMHRI